MSMVNLDDDNTSGESDEWSNSDESSVQPTAAVAAAAPTLDLVQHMYAKPMAVPAAAPRTEPQCTIEEMRAVKDTDYAMVCKIVLLGDSGVDKSKFLQVATSARTNKSPVSLADNPSTIGVDFQVMVSLVNGVDVVKTQLWDTAGQEKFSKVVSGYARGAKGLIVFYDTTNLATLSNVNTRWMEMIADARQRDANTVAVLIGTKSDAVSQRRVMREMGEQFARRNGFDAFFETSIINRDTIDAAVDRTISIVYTLEKARQRRIRGREAVIKSAISIEADSKKQRKRCCNE